jgi:hypothetical protein
MTGERVRVRGNRSCHRQFLPLTPTLSPSQETGDGERGSATHSGPIAAVALPGQVDVRGMTAAVPWLIETLKSRRNLV